MTDDDIFPFQRVGAQWLAARRFGLLADEMGLGKSAQAILAADAINAERILVLCPASVRINWLREWQKFSMRGADCVALLDGKAHSRLTSQTRIAACSYDLAVRSETRSSLRNWLASRQNTLLIPDEAHYVKGTDAKRTHAVLGRDGLIHAAHRTWALSGTPAPNHAGELYPMLRCFGVIRDSYDAFTARFCVSRHTPFGRQITGSRNISELRALIAPVILRRKKVDVMKELPALTFRDLVVEPGPVDEEIYFPDYYVGGRRHQQMHENMGKARNALEVNMEVLGQATAANVTALQGLANAEHMTTLRRYAGLQKVPAVADIVASELEFGAYEKIVLFAVHRDVIEELRIKLKHWKPVTLYGGTPAEKRQANIDRFQKDPRCRVFIGQVQAAGTGIDGLQRVCHTVMLVECDWVPGSNAQAVMRLHRIGQEMPVTVRVVGLANDVDERVQKVLRRKSKELTELFD